MQLPGPLDALRQTRLWQRLRDWRYLRRQRARRIFYRQFVPPRSLVFDIGANVGHYTLIFQSLSARVLAVEPQAELAAGLRRRFAGSKDVQIVQTALGRQESTATLHKATGLSEVASLRTDISERSRFANLYDRAAVETVPVTTLVALVQQYGRPDFCKIDVEGFEIEVLAGLNTALPLVSFEFNREFWPETEVCLNCLDALGRYRFNYALGENDALELPDWPDSRQLRAVLVRRSPAAQAVFEQALAQVAGLDERLLAGLGAGPEEEALTLVLGKLLRAFTAPQPAL